MPPLDGDSALDPPARPPLGTRALGLARTLLNRQLVEVNYGWGPRSMSELRKRWVLFCHPHADIRFGKGVHLGPGFSLYIPGPGMFIVSDHTEFRGGFAPNSPAPLAWSSANAASSRAFLPTASWPAILHG